VIVNLVLAGLVIASWTLRPPSRMLGELFPAGARCQPHTSIA
jgi:hypothetical protein